MRNKKGFTLVELVIVIAVIAILAGVMIGTFASVVKKAKESAKMQEMANQKQQQMIDDIDAKLKDDAWLGWEDFEEKLATAVGDAITKSGTGMDEKTTKLAVTQAVEAAFAKYAASLGQSNTGLTEEQVKYIVESALAKNSYTGVTEAQVKAIVNNATSGLSNLNKSQVNAIVSQIVNAASEESKLTLSQITIAIKALDEKVTSNANKLLSDKDIEDAVDKAMKEYGASTLDADDITALLAKYVSNGTVKGDYTWYNANATTMEIKGEKAADQLVALATITKGGESFEGKTITLEEGTTVTLENDWEPIAQGSYATTDGFCGTFDGNGATITIKNFDMIFSASEGRNGYNAFYGLNSNDQVYVTDKVAFGFIACLGKGGVMKNVTINYSEDFTMADPANKYTYFGGAVGLLDGGTIDGVKVTGAIKAYNRVGGLVGIAASGEIKNCEVSAKINSKIASNSDKNYCRVGGLIGWADSGLGTIGKCGDTLTTKISGCTVPVLSNLSVDDSMPVTDTVPCNTKTGAVGTYIGGVSNNNAQNGYKAAADITVVEFDVPVKGNGAIGKQNQHDNDAVTSTVAGKTVYTVTHNAH